MNKIFKVIWSKSKQCYIVVSEIAKNKTGKKKIVVAGIFAALAMVNGGQATFAAWPAGGEGAQSAFWMGRSSSATGQNAQAIGVAANASSAKSVAIGSDSFAQVFQVVAKLMQQQQLVHILMLQDRVHLLLVLKL